MIDQDTRKKKQSELNDLIRCISIKYYDQGEIASAAEKLNSIYDDNFRHMYSDFISVINKAYSDDGDLAVMLENLEAIYNYAILENSGCNNSDRIFKLLDHLNIECSRFEQSLGSKELFDRSFKEIEKLKGELQITEQSLKEAQEKLAGEQVNVISTISLFSAIVLTFFGGISFISSAVTAAKDTNTLKLAFIIILAGSVVGNVVFSVLSLLNKIFNKKWTVSTAFVVVFNIIAFVLLALILVALHFFPDFVF